MVKLDRRDTDASNYMVNLRVINGFITEKKQNVSNEIRKNTEVIDLRVKTLLGVLSFIERDIVFAEELHDETRRKLKALLLILEQDLHEIFGAQENVLELLDHLKRKSPSALQ